MSRQLSGDGRSTSLGHKVFAFTSVAAICALIVAYLWPATRDAKGEPPPSSGTADRSSHDRSDAAGHREAVDVILPLPWTSLLPPGWLDVRFGDEPPSDLLAKCERRRMDDGETPRFCSACRSTNDPLFRCADVEVADGDGTVGLAVSFTSKDSRAAAITALTQRFGRPGKTRENGLPCWESSGVQAFITERGMLVVTPASASPYNCVSAEHAAKAVTGQAAQKVCRRYAEAWERMCSRCNNAKNACSGVRVPMCNDVVQAASDASLAKMCIPALDGMSCDDYKSGYLPAACWMYESYRHSKSAVTSSPPTSEDKQGAITKPDAVGNAGDAAKANERHLALPGWEDVLPGGRIPADARQKCTREDPSRPLTVCSACRSASLPTPCIEIMVGNPDLNTVSLITAVLPQYEDDAKKVVAALKKAWGRPTSSKRDPALDTDCWDTDCWDGAHEQITLMTLYYDMSKVDFDDPNSKAPRAQHPRRVVAINERGAGLSCPR